MKFTILALFLTFAVAISMADNTAPRCSNCPNSLNAVDGLLGNLQTSLATLLNHLPLGLGDIVNELLKLVRTLLTNVGNDVSGLLRNLLNQVGTLLGGLLGGGGIGISTPDINIPGIKIPGIKIPGINL